VTTPFVRGLLDFLSGLLPGWGARRLTATELLETFTGEERQLTRRPRDKHRVPLETSSWRPRETILERSREKERQLQIRRQRETTTQRPKGTILERSKEKKRQIWGAKRDMEPRLT
jgi:hypothetical protein